MFLQFRLLGQKLFFLVEMSFLGHERVIKLGRVFLGRANNSPVLASKTHTQRYHPNLIGCKRGSKECMSVSMYHGINWVCMYVCMYVCIVHSLPKIFGERYGDFSSGYGTKIGSCAAAAAREQLEGGRAPSLKGSIGVIFFI